ncbi:MAG TPA: hypothetical protein VMZ31_19670 [Phycisphaerae bacterium]|nr:hypothetical protein [Phycisphaerae bacterium]
MPTWRTKLPAEEKNRGFDLRRTPTNGNLVGIITCKELLICDTHYWHGRTMPCERECNEEGRTVDDSHCPACQEKAAWRSHVYVSAFDGKRREHFIFECTTNAAKTLQEYYEAAGTLRGCILNACRPKGTPNGKVSILTHAADLSKNNLPEPPDIALTLCMIWRVPRTGLAFQLEHDRDLQPHRSKRTKATHARASREPMDRMRNQPDNAADPQTIGDFVKGNGQALHIPSHT